MLFLFWLFAKRRNNRQQDARDMTGAQVAACDYAPAGWPDGTYTLVRRVKVAAAELSTDPRSRRRRTVHKDQLALALNGDADHAWAVSFIVTNIPANHGDLVGLEAWFRNRTAIEERFREAKHGGGLNHLPSADPAVNAVWTWAGLLAGALSVILQSLTSLDTQARPPRPDADRDAEPSADHDPRQSDRTRPRARPTTTTPATTPRRGTHTATSPPRSHLTLTN